LLCRNIGVLFLVDLLELHKTPLQSASRSVSLSSGDLPRSAQWRWSQY
jgi:hypothetical protein